MDLGELGFWLAAGIALAAWILSTARTVQTGIREKQATIREIMRLEAEGKSAPETLKYLREQDAAYQAERDRDRQWEKVWGRRVLAGIGAFIAAVVVFLVTIRIFNGAGVQPQSWQALIVLVLPFVTAGFSAFLVYILIRGKKNVPPPGA